VLHDLVMRDFFHGCLLTGRIKQPEQYLHHFAFCHGEEGRQLARTHLDSGCADDVDNPNRLRLPMFRSAVHGALTVVVHSECARRRVAEVVSAPVALLDFPPDGSALTRFNVQRYSEQFSCLAEQAARDRPLLVLADRAAAMLAEQGTQLPEGLLERVAAEIAALGESARKTDQQCHTAA
jgi:hypothetical protein